MRPYRGLTKKGEWVYGWYQLTDPSTPDKIKHYIIDCCGVTSTALVLAHDISDLPGYHEVIPETVGQSTGRKDKNDKEIYTNDQIAFSVNKKFGTDKRYEGRVYFCEKRLAYCVKCLPAWDMPIYHNLIDIEIIHQHQKLLEQNA